MNQRNPKQESTEGYDRDDGFMPGRTPELLSRNKTGSDSWSTSWRDYHFLNWMFDFTIDVAAHAGNHKHKRYFSADPDDPDSLGNGLKESWAGETVFCQPPYADLKSTRNQIGWAEKCATEYEKDGYNTTVVMLIPCRPYRRYFINYLANAEVYFFDRILSFLSPVDNLHRRENTVGSRLVVFSRDSYRAELAQFGTQHPTFQSISVDAIREWWLENQGDYQ